MDGNYTILAFDPDLADTIAGLIKEIHSQRADISSLTDKVHDQINDIHGLKDIVFSFNNTVQNQRTAPAPPGEFNNPVEWPKDFQLIVISWFTFLTLVLWALFMSKCIPILASEAKIWREEEKEAGKKRQKCLEETTRKSLKENGWCTAKEVQCLENVTRSIILEREKAAQEQREKAERLERQERQKRQKAELQEHQKRQVTQQLERQKRNAALDARLGQHLTQRSAKLQVQIAQSEQQEGEEGGAVNKEAGDDNA
ncbi:hypothetical protein COCC4DRAFT_36317 [Bipolaris maydis ATCC 48331]|uniref:Uncharacterized protein n=2 Tax=Cochliobolus heterostrophus TaxID=5016 RepID=M2TTJ5_COCH5|nr:uncharacterized protein COCC4DRAFT_36317 [Bipolaris maydis ATCC 48331]EMD89829.1 hypothetical protein COCHEDRAFT_1214882 [Bipolaris maydis C5]KAJ5025470.1 hypothetical protein J3E73DRAFT_258220 [Bipolaris maydis]ENI09958.1 hypothetical protein COCC4DRAFT_36317 [Bipolaris maydis ATCC 48331]KAJ5064072.1 hypothetical protein J3E74DRAFT_286740 [Bipolaris maydis]KAJ6196781.1 hypothetical protein J3E72DRAFT_269683 [Bipolaris maydis]